MFKKYLAAEKQHLMFRKVFLLPTLFITMTVYAQPWLKRDIPSANPEARKRGLKELSAAFNDYWKDKTVSTDEENNAEEGGYQQFRRWE